MNLNPLTHRLLPPAYEPSGFSAEATAARLAQKNLSGAITQSRAVLQTEAVPKVPGLAIAVAMDGVLVWSEQFGFANLATQTPITPTTRFRIASVSKPLTAAGLALLVERGQMDLDAPVQTYIPDFPQKNGVITIRQLAGHLTGIRNYKGREAVSNVPYPNLRSGLKIFENDPLESVPGTKFSYCSYNWNVLGAAMEAAAKQEFTSFMAEAVFKPLGLANTLPNRVDVADPQRTSFYETDPQGKFFTAPPIDPSYKWPSGGFLSTVEDLAVFGTAHLWPGFLKKESLARLFTSQKTAEGHPTNYGIGWVVQRNIPFHTGGIQGGTSMLMLHPPTRTVVALLTNGSQLQLRAAVMMQRMPPEAGRFIFSPEWTTFKILKLFATA